MKKIALVKEKEDSILLVSTYLRIVTQKNRFLLTNKLTTFSTAKETKNETKKITDSESTSKKGEVTLDSFLNFTYSAVICI